MELFNNAIRTIQIIKENLKKKNGVVAFWHCGFMADITNFKVSSQNTTLP